MKIFFVILCTYLGFCFIDLYPKSNLSLIQEIQQLTFNQIFAASPTLAHAFVTGEKSLLPKPMLDSHQTLGLLHLFTLSGLHLRYFLMPIRLFRELSIAVGHARLGKNALLIFTAFFLFIFWNYNSMRRVLFFSLTTQVVGKKQYSTYIFYITFMLDFMTGGFAQNPLSFLLSFLFWGIILFSQNWFTRIVSFVIGYQIVNYFLNQNVSIIGLILGQVITHFFAPVFASSLVLKLLTYFHLDLGLFNDLWKNILAAYQYTVVTLASLNDTLPLFQSNMSALFFLVLLGGYQYSRSYGHRLVPIFFMFLTFDLNSYEIPDPSKINFLSKYYPKFKVITTHEGELIYFDKKVICQYKINKEVTCFNSSDKNHNQALSEQRE